MVNELLPAELEEEDDGIGFDLSKEENIQDEEFESSLIDLDQAEEKSKTEPSWKDTISDIFVQSGRGALRAVSWPLDLLKAGIIGEGLTDIDELESAAKKQGIPFDRDEYVRKVYELGDYVPTQGMAEEAIENQAGFNLEPKTPAGRYIKQGAEIFGFSKGGLVKKAGKALLGVGSTLGLEAAGLDKDKAEIAGDLIAFNPISRGAPELSKEAAKYEDIAQKHSLPYLRTTAREKGPRLKGNISQKTAENLRNNLGVASEEALQKIVSEKSMAKRLQNSGVNLDALAEQSYARTNELAKANPKPIKTDQLVKNIDNEISRIKSLAPSPSEAEKAALNILENEREVFKVTNPNAEQIIKQNMNYNSNMKSLYRKPEFTGKEDEVRKTYEFLKKELLEAAAQQGEKEFADSFKAANKIYHEKLKLDETEKILGKAFKGENYNPKALHNILNSKQGLKLKRNLGSEAIEEIEDIAKFGKKSEEGIKKFLNIKNDSIASTVATWGSLAPYIVFPGSLLGPMLSWAPKIVRYVQGKLLLRPAARKVFKSTLEHAAEGSFNLLKKDMFDLEQVISKEFGSVDNFLDAGIYDLDELDEFED